MNAGCFNSCVLLHGNDFFDIFAKLIKLYCMKRLFLFCGLIATITCGLCAQAKYVFYFIGDGMGANQVMTTEMYMAAIEGRIGVKKLTMTQFPYSGQLSTFSASHGITDSSAAGTCLASGTKTTNGKEGVDTNDQPVENVAEMLKKQGWGIGVASSVTIDHATPGAFYAHVSSRSDYYTIGTQLASADYDFVAGASFSKPFNSTQSTGEDLFTLCEKNGYHFVRGYDEFAEKYKGLDKVIMIQPQEANDEKRSSVGMLPYAIDKQEDNMTLPQIVEAGIKQLQKHNRFFFMCEGGAIDWACHSNDAATVVHEVMEFDQAIQVAYEFYLQHPEETLIIVTADHETGGMALGNGGGLNLKLLQNQKVSAGVLNEKIKEVFKTKNHPKWEDIKKVLKQNLGFFESITILDNEEAELYVTFEKMLVGEDQDVKTLYNNISELSNAAIKLLNKHANIGWTTQGHSASPVPLFAIGEGADKFSGWHDNSQVVPMILSLIVND
jgi:alkaline phosphatase